MTNKHKNLLLLILIIAFGIFLRTININRYLTWQDEAETIINSIQVIEDGYPHGYFKGKPMFESISFIKINDPIYRYASANYYGSKYENNKGWLTYYYLAPFIKTFGVSETSTRLPFLLFYVLTTIVLYAFSNKLFKNKKIALLATFIFAIDYFAIYYEPQARYYAITIFLSLLSLYLNYLYIHSKKSKHLFLLTTVIILIFHTHIILCLSLGLFFIYYDFIKTKKIKFNRYIIYNLAYFLLFTIPWLILVEFWVNFHTHNVLDNKESIKILLPLMAIITYIIIIFIKKILENKTKIEISKTINIYLLYSCLTYVVIVPMFIPIESFTPRLFIPLIPVCSIIFAKLFYEIFKNKKTLKKNTTYILIILLIYILLLTKTGHYENYGTTNNIRDMINYAKEINLTQEDMITLNWQDLPLSLYTDYNVYHTTTLQADFFNNYQGRILAIFLYKHIEKDLPKKSVLSTYVNTHKFWLIDNDNFKIYYPRLSTCEQKTLGNDILLFDCPALSE